MQDVRETFANNLAVLLEEYNFKYVKSRDRFIRKYNDQEFWFSILTYKYREDAGYYINPTIQIRVNQVENIFHIGSSFNAKQKKETSTIGCSIENYMNDNSGAYRFYIEALDDVKPACKFILQLFKDIAIPFFEEYDNLIAIERHVNEEPLRELAIINPIFRGSKGLIMAKLVGNCQFPQLKRVYTEFYSNFADGFYLDDFEKVVVSLKSIEI